MDDHNLEIGKLVRDKIPEIMRMEGIVRQFRTRSHEEFVAALFKKLEDETLDLKESDDDGRLEEIADLREVVNALVTALGWSIDAVEEQAAVKKSKRGAFDTLTYLLDK